MAHSILIDPLGRRVVLHDHTWYGHIIVGHPEVRDARLLVERAVRQPLEIRLSLSDPRCRMYYGHGPRSTVKMLAVANIDEGVVKTAHLVRRFGGGSIEWSRPIH